MNFASAIREEMTHTLTENGARAKNTSGNACLDFFSTVGALRNTDIDRKIRLFEDAYNEDSLTALRTLFYARDIRGGLGERATFRTILKDCANRYPEVIKGNITLIPFYGRWDDLYSLIGTKCEDDMWKFMRKQFEEDWVAYLESAVNPNVQVSLLAKWVHNGNESSKKSRQLGILTANKLGYDVYTFKRMVIKLRKYIDIVEAHMSANDWENINYSSVPGRAAMIYRNAFVKHDYDRYNEYLDSVNSGKEKIHTDTLYPYDIINKVMINGYWYRDRFDSDPTLQTLWDNLPNYVDGEHNALVIADTSGSMSGMPICVALSLAIYFAQRNKGAYNGLWMTFSEKPKYQRIKGDKLTQILNNMDMTGWGCNTNLHAALKMVLNTAIRNSVPPEEVPASLIVISDMEIDYCTGNSWSFYDDMKKEYEEHGYNIPNIVFWNVNSRHDIYHADSKRKGVQLVSGQSASTFKTLMKSIGMTPIEYMNSVVNSERYLPVKI